MIFCGGFGKSSESFLQLLRPPPDPRDALDTQLEKEPRELDSRSISGQFSDGSIYATLTSTFRGFHLELTP